MFTLIFGILVSEPPPSPAGPWWTTEKAGPDKVKLVYLEEFVLDLNG